MIVSQWHYDWLVGIFVLFLMLCHYITPVFKRMMNTHQRRLTSFAGGVAVGYVFLHMLPELVESRDHMVLLLHQAGVMTPLKDLIVFSVALIGFQCFYCMERYATQAVAGWYVLHQRVFRFHLAMYCVYNFLLTYTLLFRLQASITYTVLFALAMGLHFCLTDNHFKRYFPHLFNNTAQRLLVLALLLGYIVSLVMTPVSVTVNAILVAFLSGAILYNAFSEEIPMNRDTSMCLFFTGTFVMALLLAFPLLRA